MGHTQLYVAWGQHQTSPFTGLGMGTTHVRDMENSLVSGWISQDSQIRTPRRVLALAVCCLFLKGQHEQECTSRPHLSPWNFVGIPLGSPETSPADVTVPVVLPAEALGIWHASCIFLYHETHS